MNDASCRFIAFALLALATLVLYGCARSEYDYGGAAVRKANGFPRLIMDSTFAVPTCGAASSPGATTRTCRFVDVDTGQSVTSVIALSGLTAGEDMQGIPVIVMQVPAAATGFSATYDNLRGTHGAFIVTAGFASLPADGSSTIVAEAGRQLVVIELPPSAPADTYFVVLALDSPTVEVKAMTTGKVNAGGRAFYPPLVPCTTNFASLPALPITATPVTTRMNVTAIASAFTGCGGKSYDYAQIPSGALATVVEYYNQALDHYFITHLANEQQLLDNGTQRGWRRTGRTFKSYVSAVPGASPICRYYLPPLYGDSHFFGRGVDECTQTGLKNPGFVLEDPQFMYMFLPVAGTCAPGTQPIYRVFSNRADANHRYMTDAGVRNDMVAAGWLAEGDGPDLVVMCGPV